MEKLGTIMKHVMNHDMIGYEEQCHEGINTTICNEHDMSSNQLSKSDWWYLVNQLEQWRVYSPRAVVKKNPQLAWQVMQLCKDDKVRVKGAYFTTCFKRELYKIENAEKLNYWRNVLKQKLGVA